MDEKLNLLKAKLSKAQADMGQVLEQAGPSLDFKKVTCVAGSDEEKSAAFRKMNDTCSDAQKELSLHLLDIKAVEDYQKRKTVSGIIHPTQDGQEHKEINGDLELGAAIIKAAGLDPDKSDSTQKGLKEFYWNKEIDINMGVSMKTLMDTTSWVPETLRTGRVVDKAARPIQVTDLIPAGQTSQAAVVYMEETTLTENAAEATEGSGIYGENAYALTERSETVRKIAAWLPVTDEQLEDVSQVRGYINNRLPMSLRRRLDSQIINGSGIAPNLTGILAKSGIQTYSRTAVAGDKPVDALRRAVTLVRVTGRAFPNGVIMHPNDWEDIRLMKTNDGAYIWGHPAEAGPDRVWGLPVSQADSLAEGTAIVADFTLSELAERRGIIVKISDSHDTYFIYGKQAIRADMRTAFCIYRAAAFCAVTL